MEKDKGLLVRDYCKQYPKLKDYTLAKKIYEENKKTFSSIENARCKVRSVRGHAGERNRKNLKDKSLFKSKNYDTTNYKPFKEEINTGAKVLVLDIETAPIRAYVWGIWNQNISINQIESDWFILTWAAKWLFGKKVYSGAVTAQEAVRQDDKRIVKSLWVLLNEADIVIAHNGEKFDIPKINSRFILNQLNPPLPYQQIDTLKHIRRQFGFTSNKLDYVNKLLNLPRKQDTGGFELWEGCYRGEDKSIKKMLSYNIQDVRILEETYLMIRAWIKPHPNMGLFILDEKQNRCPSCGSKDLSHEGHYHTTANVFEAFRCDNCGGVGRMRLSKIHIKQKRFLTLSTPK